ncbi:MAG: hypothetical protein K6G45_04615 [Lachnospiraceae bacterium]|nr:hypothetical protein [Lachnospiraceae bacterium]
MGEFLKERYFILVRVILLIAFGLYGIMTAVTDLTGREETGVSVKILLLVSFFISFMALKEFGGKRIRIAFLAGSAIVLFLLVKTGGPGFMLLGYYLGYEFLLTLNAGILWYVVPVIAAVFAGIRTALLIQLLAAVMTALFYIQYVFIVSEYRKQIMEETRTQQGLKKDIERRENATRAELKKNILEAENRVLEERAQLSQTLHDKLGHNINGSIYQLEAGKVIMDKDPEKARGMIQGVIDQLRSGMDEIRAILRKERPDKKQMALLQLYELCEDCNKKGVEAEITTEGDLTKITADVWEVILDNAFESVTNSMKYSRCKHITIEMIVMNMMVRCIISDDGTGCEKIVEGMGISGMRQRSRAVGGTVDFETEAGFRVNMLLPLGRQ